MKTDKKYTYPEMKERKVVREVYSLYLNGLSAESIRHYFWHKSSHNLTDDDINDMIDFCNEFNIV